MFLPQEVASVLWSFATLAVCDESVFASFAEHANKNPVVIQDFEAQSLANIAWANAACGARQHQFDGVRRQRVQS